MIDLATLPAPAVVEALDFEAIYAAKLARFQALYPQFTAAFDSDPVVKLLQLAAYDELTLRARINDAARAVLLPYATGPDLDNLAALFSVQRLLITPADPTASPPVDAVYEGDDALRARVQMAPDGFTVAGSAASYRFHALSASGKVADAGIDSPTPGVVRVSVLSREGDGTPGADLLAQVQAALSADDVRPLTDLVSVQAANFIPATVAGTLYRVPGPEGDVGVTAAQNALAAYVASRFRLGADLPRSGLFAALHQPGIVRVVLDQPASDLTADITQAIRVTASNLAVVVSNER
jgi:phage-related baseplate assembly protein